MSTLPAAWARWSDKQRAQWLENQRFGPTRHKAASRDLARNRVAARQQRAALTTALRAALRTLPEAEAAQIIGEYWATSARLVLVHEAHVRRVLARAGIASTDSVKARRRRA